MTEQTARTPYAHKIRYGVTGAPHLPSPDLPAFGVIPALVELIYSAARGDRPARISASVTGYLTRDGKKVRPGSEVAQHYVDGPDGWPAWLAAEARHHAPVVRDAARTASGQQPETVPTPEEGIEDARKVIQHVLQLFLDRVPRNELDAETMADSLTDALSDGLTELYRSLAQAETALAAVGQPAEAQATDRCPSCEHGSDIHDVDGRCWFTVEQGVPERDLVCSCKLRRMAEEARS